MERIKATVEMVNIYKYEKMAYAYWKGTETHYIYTMKSDDGTVYVWRTSTFFCNKFEDPEHGWDIDAKGRKWNYAKLNRGDRFKITASVVGESEYKGQPQTELTRVKCTEVLFIAKTEEEIEAERLAAREQKKQEQLDSLREGDFIWRMPYRQYKEHYSDCETVIDSFEKHEYEHAHISVIIRDGRLKNSGVRGQTFSGYEFSWFDPDDGKEHRSSFRAVSEENAMKQLYKFCSKAQNITPGRIYHYASLY